MRNSHVGDSVFSSYLNKWDHLKKYYIYNLIYASHANEVSGSNAGSRIKQWIWEKNQETLATSVRGRGSAGPPYRVAVQGTQRQQKRFFNNYQPPLMITSLSIPKQKTTYWLPLGTSQFYIPVIRLLWKKQQLWRQRTPAFPLPSEVRERETLALLLATQKSFFGRSVCEEGGGGRNKYSGSNTKVVLFFNVFLLKGGNNLNMFFL